MGELMFKLSEVGVNIKKRYCRGSMKNKKQDGVNITINREIKNIARCIGALYNCNTMVI